ATEVKVPEIVDAVVELTETGRSLEANNLRVIDVLLESTTKFIANKNAWCKSEKRRKIENLSLLLEGTILAQQKVGLKMNAPRESLRDILSLLPSMKAPTISKLDASGWFSLEVVVTDKHVREFIPELKRYGACDIIEYQLNKVIL
ncbi:MAG: ATP phosphoribosyltransferase, partial [Candidatus Diapherotrites archaeon]|nr:ATP phosphoribosyltransferase [Candidatus Diapherotrites archaeon]